MAVWAFGASSPLPNPARLITPSQPLTSSQLLLTFTSKCLDHLKVPSGSDPSFVRNSLKPPRVPPAVQKPANLGGDVTLQLVYVPWSVLAVFMFTVSVLYHLEAELDRDHNRTSVPAGLLDEQKD